MSKLEHDADLDDYELYVLEALYLQETQVRGRELTLGEQHKIRMEYIKGLSNTKLARKRQYKRVVKPDEAKDFQWQPSVSSRKIRPL
ncbi:TPA: DUF3811 domain-containing protein [Escherichia coli]|nr:DUF3811 domain-containing protein [Escherichia coli]HAM4871932.1 DUF3811 domain-containing protein [Escherichia coli]